jgi:hypothetical protein
MLRRAKDRDGLKLLTRTLEIDRETHPGADPLGIDVDDLTPPPGPLDATFGRRPVWHERSPNSPRWRRLTPGTNPGSSIHRRDIAVPVVHSPAHNRRTVE